MNQPNKAFKVFQASAGSGKTYTIAKEYLKLCLANEEATDNYQRILAITFTNKAANEMKAKILRHLNDIIDSDLNDAPGSMEATLADELHLDRTVLKAHAALLFQKIIHDYSGFCVSTIDAFVQKLSRAFARELGLPSQFNVSIDEDEVADAITERIGEQIGNDNGTDDNGTEGDTLTKILADFSEMKLSNEKSPHIDTNIHDFVKKLFSEEAFQKHEENHFTDPTQYQETLDFIQGKVEPFEARCKQFTIDFEDFIRQHSLTDDDFNYKTKGPCLSLLKSLKEGKYTTLGDRQRQLIDGNFNWYAKALAKRSDFNELDTDFQHVAGTFLKTYQNDIGSYLFYKSQLGKLSLYLLRSTLRREIEAYIGEAQIVPISEFNKRINKIMDDFTVPFVYERIGERLQHLFIDEFQDTSVLQWQNLLPLLDNSLSNQHLSMVVGDGKQSIYRWRNGEVGQLTSLPEIFGKPDDIPTFRDFERNLIQNFEFTELKTNHRSFENIIDFNNDFFLFSSEHLPDDCRKVYVEKSPLKEVSVKQLHYDKNKGYVQVELLDDTGSDDGPMLARIVELIHELTGKGFLMSDITILVRKNSTGSLIANYLNENGIDVVSSESILLKSSNRVQLIVNTLDYLIHDDNAAVIATVLYYWNATRNDGFDGTVDGFFDQANAIARGEADLEATMGMTPGALKSLLAQSYSLYDLCSAIIRLYGFQAVGDPFLSFLLDVVYKWQLNDANGIGSFLSYWEKKNDKLAILSGNENAVKIMTIHKSKGLEFNVVICPFVVDNLDDKKAVTRWIAPEELGFEAIPNIDKVQFTLSKDSATWSAKAKALYELENAKVRLDNLNINYVAFTRAVQRLHILSYQVKDPDEGKNPLNAFLADQGHQAAYGDPDTRKVELKKEGEVPRNVYADSVAGEWFDKIDIDPDPSMFWISRDDPMKPQEWGEFVHRIFSEVQHGDDLERAMKPHLDAGEIDGATAAMLTSWFRQMVAHPVIGEAFSAQAKVKNECDILLANGDIVRPDRYAELPDKVILLDYKTGQKSEEHHRQLRTYMDTVSQMVAKPIEGYLVYLGDTVEVIDN